MRTAQFSLLLAPGLLAVQPIAAAVTLLDVNHDAQSQDGQRLALDLSGGVLRNFHFADGGVFDQILA